MSKNFSQDFFSKFLFFIIIFILGIGIGTNLLSKNQTQILQAEKNTPHAFVAEVYDKILENYWDNLSDAQLLELFKQSMETNGDAVQFSKLDKKEKLLATILNTSKNMEETKRNQFIASVTNTVLASLNPLNRSGLYTEKQEEQLKNTVNNVNPDKDLYKDLGVSKESTAGAIAKAYQEKIKTEKDPEKLKKLTYANDVLSKEDTKTRYTQGGVEPTIFAKIISPGILYLQFKKFSPTSYDEFVKAFEAFKNNSDLKSLVFDLRGNIGGAIDSTSYFLGNFIGKNQYAFDFYHKGEYLPFKTPTDKLPSISKYKQVVILVDNQTQSSAEIMAASLKKYRVGVVLGVPTKGWGTVEKVFPIDNQFDKANKYSLFLVHSITLRDDNLPIEGRGVEPDINIKSTNWQQQLFSYFMNQPLANAVKSLY